jgi:hypothetical protein
LDKVGAPAAFLFTNSSVLILRCRFPSSFSWTFGALGGRPSSSHHMTSQAKCIDHLTTRSRPHHHLRCLCDICFLSSVRICIDIETSVVVDVCGGYKSPQRLEDLGHFLVSLNLFLFAVANPSFVFYVSIYPACWPRCAVYYQLRYAALEFRVWLSYLGFIRSFRTKCTGREGSRLYNPMPTHAGGNSRMPSSPSASFSYLQLDIVVRNGGGRSSMHPRRRKRIQDLPGL